MDGRAVRRSLGRTANFGHWHRTAFLLFPLFRSSLTVWLGGQAWYLQVLGQKKLVVTGNCTLLLSGTRVCYYRKRGFLSFPSDISRRLSGRPVFRVSRSIYLSYVWCNCELVAAFSWRQTLDAVAVSLVAVVLQRAAGIISLEAHCCSTRRRSSGAPHEPHPLLAGMEGGGGQQRSRMRPAEDAAKISRVDL